MKNSLKYLLLFFKWTLFSLIIGISGGLVGAAFHYTLRFVTEVRSSNKWLILLLPVGAVLTVLLYKLLKLSENRGVNGIIDAISESKAVSPLIAPAIFAASAISHLFGASSGREGAALQLGGSIASFFAKIFRLKDTECKVLVMCGMASVFAGLFGTPLTAALFTLEFGCVGTILSPAVFPCSLSAFIASSLSKHLGVHAETAVISTLQPDFLSLGKIALLAVCISLLSILVCECFHKTEHLASKIIPSKYLKGIIGAVIIIIGTVLVGDMRYSGTGMTMALDAVAGSADPYDFILKILFTAVTIAAGFKGGEIVPVFCIGATFGCFAGSLLGLDPGVCAAIGLVGLFCCVTNSPFASIFLSIEMFGAENFHIFAVVCIICFALSGHSGLYSSQLNQYHKVTLKRFKE